MTHPRYIIISDKTTKEPKLVAEVLAVREFIVEFSVINGAWDGSINLLTGRVKVKGRDISGPRGFISRRLDRLDADYGTILDREKHRAREPFRAFLAELCDCLRNLKNYRFVFRSPIKVVRVDEHRSTWVVTNEIPF